LIIEVNERSATVHDKYLNATATSLLLCSTATEMGVALPEA